MDGIHRAEHRRRPECNARRRRSRSGQCLGVGWFGYPTTQQLIEHWDGTKWSLFAIPPGVGNSFLPPSLLFLPATSGQLADWVITRPPTPSVSSNTSTA